MKKNILVLTLGIMIGLIAGNVSGAFAAVGDKLEVVVTKFTFLIDGEEKKVEADPLSLNGTTYLPLRAVANMLGKDVIYRAKENVIELNTPSEELSKMDTTISVEETTYEGLKAIIVDDVTYFDMKSYNDKFDPILWGYDKEKNEIFLAKTLKGTTEIQEVLFRINKNDPNAYYVYQGRSHINTKYYQVPDAELESQH